MMQPVSFCNCRPTIRKKSREVDKAFIYKENGGFGGYWECKFCFKKIVNDRVDRKR